MKKLIIIDDEKLMRQKMATLLDYQTLGFNLVALGEDGLEGEEMILIHRPDVVITDVVMPGKTGLEMIASLQGKMKTKYVILSGYQEFGYVREALRLGAADYLLKPVQAMEFQNVLEGLFATTEKEKDFRRYGEIVGKVLALIEEELSDADLSLKALCENHLFMNETYVSRLFQKRTGQKFSGYLTSCRMEAAKVLLVYKPELSVEEVAHRVGFGSGSKYFIEVFRKHTGITPGKYRSHISQ